MVSRRRAKSIGPTSIFLFWADSSRFDVLELCLPGDLSRSTAFIRELVVVAVETGSRGLELRRVGDSFGGGGVMKALRRLPLGVLM